MSPEEQAKRKELEALLAEEIKQTFPNATEDELSFVSYKCSLITLNAINEEKKNQIGPAIG